MPESLPVTRITGSVVIPRLKEIHPVFTNQIHDTGHAESLRPTSTYGERSADWSRPNSAGPRETLDERPPHAGQGPLCAPYVMSSRPSSRRRDATDCGATVRCWARVSAVNKRSAFLGERKRWAVSSKLLSSEAEIKATSSAPRRACVDTDSIVARTPARASKPIAIRAADSSP